MLRAFLRRWLLNDSSPTPSRRDERPLTRDDLAEAIDAALDEHMKLMNYEWNEWYEKFDKLHLRLAKRAQRAERQGPPAPGVGGEDRERPVSVLHHRRLGSV